MERYLPFLVIAILYAIVNPIVRKVTGINQLIQPPGWCWWFYDSPAFLTGVAAGYFLLKNGFLR